MEYIAYCRKSRDEVDRQVLSIEAQISEIKEFAKKENLEIVEFIEEAKTAKCPGREKFAEVIRKIQKGEAQGIIAWHPDRLARNSIDGGKLIYLLDTGKLQNLKFITHWFENTPQGKFMLSIAFGQSKYYIDNLSENVRRGLRQKLRNGVWPAKAPMGYQNNAKTRSVDIDPEKSKAVKKAFELFSNGDKTFTDIAEFLAKFGISRKNNKPLHINQIRKILRDKFYVGLMFYGGEYHEGTHQCFVSKELFKKVQEELEKRNRYFEKSHHLPFLGLARCSQCGAAITAEEKHKFYKGTNRHATYVYYRCTKKLGPCSQPAIRSEIMEDLIREKLLEVKFPEGWKSNWLKWAERDAVLDQENSKDNSIKLGQEVKISDQKLKLLLDGYLDQVIDSETYKQKKNELFLEKIRIQEEIKKLEEKGISWLEPFQEWVEKASQLEKIARAKKNSEDLRIFAQMVGSDFRLENRQLRVKFKEPFAALRVRALTPSADSFSLSRSQSVGETGIGPAASRSQTERSTDELLPASSFSTCSPRLVDPEGVEPSAFRM